MKPLSGLESMKVDLNPPLASEPAKPWWQSTGVLGGLATVIVAGLSAAGINVPADAVILVLTGAISVYGRVRATRPITASLTTPTKP